jgi:hypothetical protein
MALPVRNAFARITLKLYSLIIKLDANTENNRIIIMLKHSGNISNNGQIIIRVAWLARLVDSLYKRYNKVDFN